MREVSCRTLGIHYEVLRERGIPPEEHFAGLKHSPAWFAVEENRIDWDTFVEVTDRLRALLDSDEELVALGRRFMRSDPVFVLNIIGQLVGSPRNFYKYMHTAGSKFFFSNLQSQFRELPTGEFELTVRIPDEYRPCRNYFLISEGAMATAPAALGYPPSQVSLTTDGRVGVFLIRAAQLPSLLNRGRALLGRLGGLRTAIRELEKNHALLQERYQELIEAQDQLSEQAIRLETVNEIGRLLATELDLERLSDAIVGALRGRVGVGYAELCIPTCPGEVFNRAQGEAPSAIHETPLIALGRTVGLLRTDIAPGEQSRRASLFADLTPWFAAAVENALSWRRQQESQTELELRVQERTRELSAAYDRLKAYDQARAEFFTNVSHELRTPLSLILAPAELVLGGQRGEISEPVRVEVRTIHAAANRLLALTNQLLDDAAVDADRLAIDRQPVSLRELVAVLTDSMRSSAERAGLALKVELGPDPAVVLGDLQRLEHAILNLLVNAVKYTSAGGEVRVRLRAEEGRAVLEVEDNGPGIAPEDQARLFDRFARFEPVRSRMSGTGLGLSLVKKVVELHEGTVSLRSEAGRGTTLTVVLPTVEGEGPRAAPIVPSDLSLLVAADDEAVLELPVAPDAPRVLIIEDHDSMRALLLRELARRYRVLTAPDGESGLEVARREKPDIVISDVMMPRLSGLEFVRRLKADPETDGIPVLLLTARRHVDARVEGLGAGAVDYLTKPFAPRELHARIEVQLALKSTSARLANAERLAGVGMLSAGFAHEVRNPLNGIANATRPLLRFIDAGDTEGARDMVQIVTECSQRLQDLANTVLDLARPVGAPVERVELCRTLDAALRLMEFRTRDRFVVVRDYQFTGTVPGEAAGLGQVWINLIDNALRAMPDGGRLTVTTRSDEECCEVLVRDSGGGIGPDHLSNLFRPFFTTRRAGDGTGLGLSLCRQIVERASGTIRVRSTSPEGTEFEVRLPLESVRQRSHETEAAAEPASQTSALSQASTIPSTRETT